MGYWDDPREKEHKKSSPGAVLLLGNGGIVSSSISYSGPDLSLALSLSLSLTHTHTHTHTLSLPLLSQPFNVKIDTGMWTTFSSLCSSSSCSVRNTQPSLYFSVCAC